MTISRKYPVETTALANYDFSDLVARTSYLTFYASNNGNFKKAFGTIIDSEQPR